MKPVSTRIEEMKKIYIELERLGLGSQFDEIKAFQHICNDYVRTGEPHSGSIPLRFVNKTLFYSFSSKIGKECVAVIRSK